MTRIQHAVTLVILRAVLWVYGRPKFKKWLDLEQLKSKIFEAIAKKEDTFPELLISYTAIAFSISNKIAKNLHWRYLLFVFLYTSYLCVPSKDLPLLKPSKEKKDKEPWDYDGRSWFMYAHIIARNYGWTMEYIANMNIDHAFAIIQEIITDEQLDREFMWSMSDKSYIYDVKTKSGKPNPLNRPYWMKEKVAPPKKISIPASMLPMGVSYESLPEEFRPKTTIH